MRPVRYSCCVSYTMLPFLNRSAQTAGQVFPNELTDRIIDHSHDDPEALSACGLVCSSWIPAVRYHRFDYVSATLDRIPIFRDLLLSSPNVRPYVNRMLITHNGALDEKTTALCDVLSGLYNLRVLNLSGLYIGGSEAQLFSSLPQSLEHVTVYKVHLRPTGTFTLLWSQLNRLRSFVAAVRVWVSSPTVPEEIRDASLSPSNTNFRLSLEMQHYEALLDLLGTPSIVTQLVTCSLYISSAELISPVAKLLHAFGPCLAALEICPLIPDDDIDGAESRRESSIAFSLLRVRIRELIQLTASPVYVRPRAVHQP